GMAIHDEMGQFNAGRAAAPVQRSAAPVGSLASAAGAVVTVKRSMPKVGRNDPCPCGSGKKYKHCHGA
ncbi:MAG TPA: SEC-C metal-binding domain-containing protein, partial [Magnetospirillaceae bacterium]|nr:SEC-C metal-binding domain-containing protein [Magnetospirillaceae bacterium]